MKSIKKKPILEWGSKMFNDVVIVTKVLSNRAFLVYNKDLNMTLDMRLLHDAENLDPWI